MQTSELLSIEEVTVGIMNVQKLFEALTELRQQKSVIENAIRHLELAIGTLNGDAEASSIAEFTGIAEHAPETRKVRQGSLFESAYKVLSRLHAPLHINELQKYVEKMIDREITRATLEGAITRHIRLRGSKSLVVRIKPSVYAIRDAPGIPTFSQVARTYTFNTDRPPAPLDCSWTEYADGGDEWDDKDGGSFQVEP